MSHGYDWAEGLEAFPILSSDEDLFENKKTSKYVKNNIPGPGCEMEDFETKILGCECDSQTCDEENCTCIAKYGQNYKNGKILFQYLQGHSMKPMLECNSLCKCSRSCDNRLVQRGIEIHLEVFFADNKGLCLRCLDSVKKGTFVCEYAGEIISHEQAKIRSSKQTIDDMNYILAVREHHGYGELKTYVDPTNFGNIGRYINHSCSPNLSMLPVRVDNMVPKICLFATKDIEALEELTFDYGHSCSSESLESSTKHAAVKRCCCGSQNCRGYLPFEPSLYS